MQERLRLFATARAGTASALETMKLLLRNTTVNINSINVKNDVKTLLTFNYSCMKLWWFRMTPQLCLLLLKMVM